MGERKEIIQNKTESENTTAKSVCALETTQSGTGSIETEIGDAESKHEKFFQKAEKDKETKEMRETRRPREDGEQSTRRRLSFSGTGGHKTAAGKDPRLRIERAH